MIPKCTNSLSISKLEAEWHTSRKSSKSVDLVVLHIVSIAPWCQVEIVLPNNPGNSVSHYSPCQVLPNAIILP